MSLLVNQNNNYLPSTPHLLDANGPQRSPFDYNNLVEQTFVSALLHNVTIKAIVIEKNSSKLLKKSLLC